MGKKVGIPKSFDLFHPIRRGSVGKKVRLVQELLCVNGFNVVIDGKFGPATQHSVCQFQEKRGLKVDGIVFEITFRDIYCISRTVNTCNSPRHTLGSNYA